MKPIDATAKKLEGGDEHVPAVSVIIPCYRAAGYIRDALCSVFAQTFRDFEVIVVNDGSPDTEEFELALEPYLDRVVYLKQENRGVSAARNAALRASRSPFIAQLDPDDLWEPEYLAVQMETLERDPSIDVLYPNALVFGDMPEAGREFMEVAPSEGEVTFESLVMQTCTVMTCVTARREMVLRAGMYDESLNCSEDFDLWLRIIKAGGRIRYHRRVLVRYRRHRGSLSSDPLWVCENSVRVLDKLERSLSLTDDEREAVGRARARFQATHSFYRGKRAFTEGDAKTAIECLKEANRFFKSRKTAVVLVLLRLAPQLLLRTYDLRDRLILKTSTRV
ncbi:MAG TPA: glycosyltransferase family A protein [Pyrinomonadaceae bacterium]|nr:glycosyltransferase family A protein [Pyrinomonadaceae bacterium]